MVENVENTEISCKKWRAPNPPLPLGSRNVGSAIRFSNDSFATVWSRSYDGSPIVGLSKVKTIHDYNDSVSSSSTTIASSASFNTTESRMNGGRISSTSNSINSDEEFNSEIKVSEASIDLSPEQSESEYSSSISSYHSPNPVYNAESCPRLPPNSKTFVENNRDELLRKAADASRNRNYSQLVSGVDSPVVVKRLSNFTLTPSRWIPPIPVSSYCGDKIDEIYVEDVVSKKTVNDRRNEFPLSPARSTTGSNSENIALVNGLEAEKSENIEKILHSQLTELMEMLAEWQRIPGGDSETVDDIRLKKRLIEKHQLCFELWQKQKRQANPRLEWKSIRKQWSDERPDRKTLSKIENGEGTPRPPKLNAEEHQRTPLTSSAYLSGKKSFRSSNKLENSDSPSSGTVYNMREDDSRASSLSLSRNSMTMVSVGDSRDLPSPTIPPSNSRNPPKSNDGNWQTSNPPVSRQQQLPVAPPIQQQFLNAAKTTISNIHKEDVSASKRSTYTSRNDDNNPIEYNQPARPANDCHSAMNKRTNGIKIFQINVLSDPRDALMAEIRCAGGTRFLKKEEAT